MITLNLKRIIYYYKRPFVKNLSFSREVYCNRTYCKNILSKFIYFEQFNRKIIFKKR